MKNLDNISNEIKISVEIWDQSSWFKKKFGFWFFLIFILLTLLFTANLIVEPFYWLLYINILVTSWFWCMPNFVSSNFTWKFVCQSKPPAVNKKVLHYWRRVSSSFLDVHYTSTCWVNPFNYHILYYRQWERNKK